MTNMESKPIQELLTAREYNLFLRFGIGPTERFKNDSQREAYRRVCNKLAAEQRRVALAQHDYFVEVAAHLEAIIKKEEDPKERRHLRELAKRFRQQAVSGLEYERRVIRRGQARVRRQIAQTVRK